MRYVFGLALLGVTATVICTAVPTKPAGSVSGVFLSVLSEVKARTDIPVLLPSELPSPFSAAKHAIVNKAAADEYAVSLYSELGIGDAGFVASFTASDNPGYCPEELANVREVKLANEVTGFFRPVSCGGSCAPANLWYKQGAVLYQIQLKLPPSLAEKKQRGIITAVANSAILAGPR
jgi:hypothetical protein